MHLCLSACEQATKLTRNIWNEYINLSLPAAKGISFTWELYGTTILTIGHFSQHMVSEWQILIDFVIRIVFLDNNIFISGCLITNICDTKDMKQKLYEAF